MHYVDFFRRLKRTLRVIPIFTLKVLLQIGVMGAIMMRKVWLPVTIRRHHILLLKRIVIGTALLIGIILVYRSFETVQNIQSVEESLSSKFKDLSDVGDQLNDRLKQIGFGRRHEPFFRNVDKIKKDWHDYEFLERERQRVGLGEHGVPVNDSVYDPKEVKRLMGMNGFNGMISDHISLNRSVPDIRHPECKNKQYLVDLPNVSIVIPFHNEYWSTLLRTCYSVLNRSPEHLIHEIILVDDFSEWDFLKTKLDEYLAKYLPKVKVIRLHERFGLIKARAIGAREATGDVLLFLDAHCEPNTNWLPPLLEPIAENYKIAMCPFIDVISYETFEYRAQDEGKRGAFDWQFYYKRLNLLPEDLAHPSRPFKSPVMAGGLFAISTKFFRELGGYDEGIDIWGGEQYELSFKIWQCGGEMYDAPCSRVGHVYRGPSDPKPPAREGDFLHRNYMRVAEVWMDEYKYFLYQRDAGPYSKIDPGDLTAQKAIREKLECKPFKWFIENVAPDLIEMYPTIEPADYASGIIQNVEHPHYCIDLLNLMNNNSIGVWECAKNRTHPYSNQKFILTAYKDIRNGDRNLCWDLAHAADGQPVHLNSCHRAKGNQLWRYDYHKKWITQGREDFWCLNFDAKKETVFVKACDSDNPNMRWEFGQYNRTALDAYHLSPLYNDPEEKDSIEH